MKKLFTLALALMAYAGVAKAETVDDIKVCKHSYVLVFDEWDGAGTEKPGKGKLFGDGYFLDVTGGSVATNKGSIDLADETFQDGKYKKYAAYGKHLNSWRLKNGQDVIAMKVTAGSKVIILGQSNSSRGAQITDKAPVSNNMQGTVLAEAVNSPVLEYTAKDDQTIYIGTKGGDMFYSYIIVEANETSGTPTVKVSDMKYDGGLYFKEVTCTPNDNEEEGEVTKTVVTYTTDGTAPTLTSPLYKNPIKVYANQTVKFQAWFNFDGNGQMDADATEKNNFIDGADNEAAVNFIFDAPTIDATGATVTITSAYKNATNYYTLNDGAETEGNSATLTESATVKAFTKITNGTYATFTTNSTTKDVYVLQPIKEAKKITASGTVELDEEATAASTTGNVYKITGPTNTADKAYFFVKSPVYYALPSAEAKLAKYQVPDGQEVYIQMSNTNITFLVAEGDKVDVKVTCSKNSCKTLNEDNDESVKSDRRCAVNVSGTVYYSTADGEKDMDNGVTAENGNIIEFQLNGEEGGSYYTFQKWNNSGAIYISSIEIAPATADGIQTVKTAETAADGAIYNIAGQKVTEAYKGVVIKGGKKVLQK